MVISEKSIRRKSAQPGDDDDWMDRDRADDAEWKRIQQNTFTRWVNEHLKTVNKYVNSLDVDLSDGIRLLSLVEVLSGKKLPKYNTRPTMKAQKLNNVDMALRFLKDEEHVKLVNISSSDIIDGNLKLILGLIWTLILHYSISMPVWEGEDDFDPSLTPKQRLLKWIQNKIPDVPVNNFTTDWNDGRALGALVDSIGPGLCPDYKTWTADTKIDNVAQALQTADDWLDVPQLLKPKEMTNPKVDEMSMMTYLSQFPNVKVKQDAPLRSSEGNPNRVRCYGPGLSPAGITTGAETRFTVETFSAGKGKLEAYIEDPKGNRTPIELKYNDDKNMTYTAAYKANCEGDHTIVVKFNGEEVPKSPFKVSIKGAPGDHRKVSAKGPGLGEANHTVRVGQKQHIDISTKGAGDGQLELVVLDPDGKPSTGPCRLRQVNPDEGQYKFEYVPQVPGKHTVNVTFAGQTVPKAPFNIDVKPSLDARKVKASGRGLQANGVRVGDVAEFQVNTEGAGEAELDIKLIGPDGQPALVNVRRNSDNPHLYECSYTPSGEGRHVVTLGFGGKEILRSPFEVNVGPASASKVTAFGPGLHGGAVGNPAKFRVATNGETGTLGFTIEGPSEAKIECKDNGDGTADVAYYPTAPGEYAIHVLSNGEGIPASPFCAQIVPRNEYSKEKFDSWYEATFKEDSANWKKSSSERRSSLKTTSTTTYHEQTSTSKTRKTTKKTTSSTSSGLLGADLLGQEPVLSMCEVTRLPVNEKPGDNTPIDLEKLEISVKLPNGEVIKEAPASLQVIDNGDGTVSFAYEPKSEGCHEIDVKYNGKPVQSSPLNFFCSLVQRGTVTAYGPGLTHGTINEPCTFNIYSRGAGPGGLNVAVEGPAKCDIDFVDQKDGIILVTYYPVRAGEYKIQVKFANENIGGSPFKAVVSGEERKKLKIVEGRPSEVIIKVSDSDWSKISAVIESPSGGKHECELKKPEDGSEKLKVKFTAQEPGIHLVHVKRGDQPVVGSPFKIEVAAKPAPGAKKE